MSEPTRPIRQPTIDHDGNLVAHTVATPKAYKVRALVTVAPRKVIPVIFVPGIMGTNLRVRQDAPLSSESEVKPGAAVWRAPNGYESGALAAAKWMNRDPRQRQLILNPNTVEVDDNGEIEIPSASLESDDVENPPPSLEDLRRRGWGEVHSGSYGRLLAELERHLNSTFRMNGEKRSIRKHWKRVMDCDPTRWGVRNITPLTEAELEKFAGYQYPLYAVGYNWLQSCSKSADRLEKRINEIKSFWSSRKHECDQVILVTHSMGGLVARACARRIPETIAGIVHGAMPALGAPVAYRRIACGTEMSSPGMELKDELKATGFGLIAGGSTAETTAVMATAPGVLELLPNHLYPRPWLHLRTVSVLNKERKYHDWVNLPAESPYPLYRDVQSWYRLIDPALADPAKLHRKSGPERAIGAAIDEAEYFHTQLLDNYYHTNTYAYYGADPKHPTFSRICWIADDKPVASRVALNPASIKAAKPRTRTPDGGRCVEVEGHILAFVPDVQDGPGDGTVPEKSGSCAGGKLNQVFATHGFEHQTSYDPEYILLLTQHLIAKIVQAVR
jgi:pimeloyl-ACP methyl ester carboxylesterase